MFEFSYAKINLFLHIVGRRSDGFHDIRSLFVFVDLWDCLSFEVLSKMEKEDRLLLDVDGLKGVHDLSSCSDNLVLRCLHAMREAKKFSEHFAVTLKKNIPVGAGLGGGSGDAAAVLRFLCRFFSFSDDDPIVRSVAQRLGSDIEPALKILGSGWALRVEGKGNPVECVPIFKVPCLIVFPQHSLKTCDVFARLTPDLYHPIQEWPECDDFERFVEQISCEKSNTLETCAVSCWPRLGDLLSVLRSLSPYAALSGSGSCCFALFRTVEDRDAADRKIADIFHDFQRFSVILGGGCHGQS